MLISLLEQGTAEAPHSFKELLMSKEMNYREERQESFLSRLDQGLKNITNEEWLPKRMLVLGHGIVAVECKDECDIYFATSMWMPKMPDLWGDHPFPPNLEALGIGYIEGIGSTNRLKNVECARPWAEHMLTPINTRWDLWESDHQIKVYQNQV